MDTAQLFFRTRDTTNAEEVLDKVQGYLAALLHNGQIVGDHPPMAKVSGGYLVTASLPETDALADRLANKWVRKRLRELTAVGVDLDERWHVNLKRRCASPWTTTSRSISGAAIRPSVNASAPRAAGHGYAGAVAPNLRLPVPALSPAVERGV